MGKGELHWHHEGGTIRSHLVGHLHLDNADDSCGRMRMGYYDERRRRDPDKVGEINVQLQRRAPGGSWTFAGHEILGLEP